MPRLCKDKGQAAKDAKKVDEKKAEGKSFFVCEKCGLATHKKDHVCKPRKA